MRALLILAGIFLPCAQLFAQDEVYYGGIGDGYSSGLMVTETVGIFTGGTGDGYSQNSLELITGSLFKGGDGDGFAGAVKETEATGLFEGGIADGYTASTHTSSGIIVFEGGDGDGYHQSGYVPKLWVGLVSQVWEESMNWSDVSIPILTDDVFIIEEAPYYPFLESGVFSINDINSTLGFCRSLNIEPMAQITFAGNVEFLNYGLFTIRGNAFFMSPVVSLVNHGLLKVKEGGVMQVFD